MDAIKKLFGYIHIILGAAVAVQFLLSEVFPDDFVGDVWTILNYLMAVGVVAALFFSYLRARDANGSDLKEWIASSAMLIASAALFLMYIEQWFAWELFKDEGDGGDFRLMVWILVDVSFPIVNIIVGRYLLRTTS